MTEFLTRAELFADGYTRRTIRRAVRLGALLHVRRDRYLPTGVDDRIVRAVRVGGRLTCLSLLAALGVFVLDNALLHVHVDPRAARLRGPQQPPRRRASSDPVRLHWSSHESPAGATVVPVIDALRHAFRCQSPRAMVATIDSALNRGLISLSELDELFALLPDRFSAVRSLVDGRAESGPETLVRLIARALGCQVELQVRFEGIGRVDLLVDGWLVVECDSREFHSDWATQRKDHARDLALAARGFPTFRVVAEDILYRPEQVLGALQGLIRSRQHV